MRRTTQRRLTFQGLPINVEIEAGEVKSGVDDLGQTWMHLYQFPYGEISGTIGADGDPVDVYVGLHPSAPHAYVVHQNRRDGAFDEDKVMLGFLSAYEAERAYREHGPDFGFGAMYQLTLEQFRNGYIAARSAPAVEIFDSADTRENYGHERYGR